MVLAVVKARVTTASPGVVDLYRYGVVHVASAAVALVRAGQCLANGREQRIGKLNSGNRSRTAPSRTAGSVVLNASDFVVQATTASTSEVLAMAGVTRSIS